MADNRFHRAAAMRCPGRYGLGIAAGWLLVLGCNRSAVRLEAPEVLSAPTTVGRAPMLAVGKAGETVSAWVSAVEGGTDGRLYISVAGRPPVELADTLGPIEAHGESPPKLAVGANGDLFAIYVVVKDVPERRFPLAALRFVRSGDHGKTWSAPVTVTDDGVFGAHNFHALHAAADGTIYVSWLGGDPGKSAAWITRSTDGGATWLPRVRVDTGEACPCCRTALGTAADGTLYMAWRHVFPGNVRDVVVARSSDHGQRWSEPVRVHADGWVFNGCPHAGPSLQVDDSGTVHMAWWTGKEKEAGVWYARSTDRGASFSEPVPLGVADHSRPAHVQLALAANRSVVVAWDDGTLKTPAIALRVSPDGGRTFDSVQWLSPRDRAAGFPVLAAAGREITVAWSEERSEVAAANEAAAQMNHPNAHKGLTPVGEAEVIVRKGIIQ